MYFLRHTIVNGRDGTDYYLFTTQELAWKYAARKGILLTIEAGGFAETLADLEGLYANGLYEECATAYTIDVGGPDECFAVTEEAVDPDADKDWIS